MHDEMIIGIKNLVELEAQICTCSMQMKFYNRSPQIFPSKPFTLKPNEKLKDLSFDVVFPQELSGHGVVKMSMNTASFVPHTTKVHVSRNKIRMSLHNTTTREIVCDTSFLVGILYIRSLGYFHIDSQTIGKSILKDHKFETLNRIVDTMNEMITYTNKSTEPQWKSTKDDLYPWLEPEDPCRHMSDEQILESTINLRESCLNSDEKTQVMRLLKCYKKAFSLRDEIGECGILPYFGSPHYRYEVLPMRLAISPAAWSVYVNILLDSFGPNRSSFIAIMDDLLIHSPFDKHFNLIEILLKGLCVQGLKLSPKKSQLFKKELVYRGNLFTINETAMVVTPICTHLEAIQNYERPQNVKDCKSFCGVINYLGMFCPELQKLLQPIYHLTKKGIPFHWTDTQQKAFEEVKKCLCKPPVLHLPNGDGRLILYSDTSRRHAGSAPLANADRHT